MKQMKNWLSCLMVLCMVLSMLPVTAYAEAARTNRGIYEESDETVLPEEDAADKPITAFHVDPLYADEITEADLKRPEAAADNMGEYYATLAAAAEDVREQVTNRTETVAVNLTQDSLDSQLGNTILEMAPVVIDSGECGENLKWVLTDDGVLTISGTGEMRSWNDWLMYEHLITELVIESGVTNLTRLFAFLPKLERVTISETVAQIAEGAFWGCSSLKEILVSPENPYYITDSFGVLYDKAMTTVLCCPGILEGVYTIPESVTRIGTAAFYYCGELTEVVIPDSVTAIGEAAFSGCQKLKSVVIPQGVTGIERSAFECCCALQSVTIPNSVRSIGEYAFNCCENLEAVVIPEYVTDIGPWAFYNGSKLTSVSIPKRVQSIGTAAFGCCADLKEIIVSPENPYFKSDDSGVLFNKEMTSLLQCPGGLAGSYAIPDGVRIIGDWSFQGCGSLTVVTIPESVTKIGGMAFSNCPVTETDDQGFVTVDRWVVNYYGESAGAIRVPDGIRGLADGAFSWASISGVELPESLISIGANAFNSCYNLTSIHIPESVVYIWEYAFFWCGSLTEATLPHGITQIAASTFADCENLTHVNIPEGVTQIGDSAFMNCRSLTGITLPENLVFLGQYAFHGCKGLDSIIIPEKVQRIDYSAFGYCSGMETITFLGNRPDFNDYAFEAVTATVYYPSNNLTWKPEYLNDYGGTLTWVPYVQEGVLVSGSCGVGMGWKLMNNGTMIISGTGAIDVPQIYDAFPWHEYRDQIKTLVLQPGVNGIPIFAFAWCSNLEKVTLPESLCYIDAHAFEDCGKLREMILPDGLEVIESSAFSGCGLENIVIPDSVTYIGFGAFAGCPAEKTDENGFVRVDHWLVGYTGESKEITIPEDIIGIARCSFAETAVQRVTISAGVKYIGDGVFNNCSALTGIWVSPENPYFVSDESGVLYNREKSSLLQCPGAYQGEYVIADGVTEIRELAFCGCRGLTDVVIPETVTSIGTLAFYGCTSLQGIRIPKGVTVIENGTFLNCTNLKYAVLLRGLKRIEEYAFCSTALISVTIPESVYKIGEWAFADCLDLTTIFFNGNGMTLDWSVFRDVHATAYYPAHNRSWNPGWLEDVFENITWVEQADIASGADSVVNGTTENLRICVLHDVAAFVGVYVDGVEVDPSSYTVTEGSTTITFTEAFLRSLDAGVHVVNILFTDTAATTTVTVVKGTPGDINDNGIVDAEDVIYLLYHTLFGDAYPIAQDCDYNNDGTVDGDDAIYLLYNTLFGDSWYPLQ